MNHDLSTPQEYLDLLDKSGGLTGKTKLKADVHRDGDRHGAAHVWILNSKNELLIQKRARTKENYPDMWDISSAGHVSSGETSITTAVREIEEELGLKIIENELRYLFTVAQQSVINDGTYIDNEIDNVYLIKRDLDLRKLKLQAEEVAEVRFMPFKDLEKIISGEVAGFVPHPEEYQKLLIELSVSN